VRQPLVGFLAVRTSALANVGFQRLQWK